MTASLCYLLRIAYSLTSTLPPARYFLSVSSGAEGKLKKYRRLLFIPTPKQSCSSITAEINYYNIQRSRKVIGSHVKHSIMFHSNYIVLHITHVSRKSWIYYTSLSFPCPLLFLLVERYQLGNRHIAIPVLRSYHILNALNPDKELPDTPSAQLSLPYLRGR